LSGLACLQQAQTRMDNHMDSYGSEAQILTDMLLTWITRANVDIIC
jgi:hypothetical protein